MIFEKLPLNKIYKTIQKFDYLDKGLNITGLALGPRRTKGFDYIP